MAYTKPGKEDIAGLVSTSGTTGNPRDVQLSRYNLTIYVLAASMMIVKCVSASDRTLSFLPWTHSFGQTAELHMRINFGRQTGLVETPRPL